MLKGLVKAGYNVYMTFYGSEFITVLFCDLQHRNILQDLAAFDSSVSVHLVRGSCFFIPFILSLVPCFIFFPLKRSKLLSLLNFEESFSSFGRPSIKLDIRIYGWFGETLKFQKIFVFLLKVPIHNTHEQKGIL